MTIMTEYQRELVEQNLELVTQVIRKRIKVNGTVLQSYDDFYSDGCEALCHAAMRYRTEMGEFAPFACVLIYHAMIDHCRKQNRLMAQSSDFQTETDNESISLHHLSADYDYDAAIDSGNVFRAVAECKERYSGVAKLGLEVLELKSIGYTSREIAQRYGTTVNNVNAWVSRARSKLLQDPALQGVLL